MARSTKLDKLAASNTLRENENMMRLLEEKGETHLVLYSVLKLDCERIIKRYPSLR